MAPPPPPPPSARALVLLFGDLCSIDTSFDNRFHELLHTKSNPLLTGLFERVALHTRAYIATLPAKQQIFPHFTTIVDLWAKRNDNEGSPVLRFFFLNVYQVAQAIDHFSTFAFPSASERCCVLGACTGSFAAAAISCSANAAQLVSNGTQAAIVAFATALESFLTGRDIALPLESTALSNSWSALVSSRDDSNPINVLEEYVNTNRRSNAELWVSGYSPSAKTVTISGSPAALQKFLSACPKTLRWQSLDVGTPFHAPSLYKPEVVSRLLSSLPAPQSAESPKQQPNFPLLGPGAGDVIVDRDLHSLLESAVSSTLREPLRWDRLLPAITQELKTHGVQSCDILHFASSAGHMVSSRIADELNIKAEIREATPSSGQSQSHGPTGRFGQSKIAIVGYSGRFPSAASNEAFWDLLMKGKDVHREIPSDRFDWKAHYDASGKKRNTSRVKFGCFMDEPGLFDARFFNMSPKEAENTDPAQRLAITTAYEAMEMAGMVPNRTPSTQADRVGVFYGTTSDDWREVNSGQDVGTYFIPGGNRAFVPGRISYVFGFSGPSLSVDTACSSSFAAIQAACANLWQGACDTALAGGTNILTNPDNFVGLDRGHFLSHTGNCNAFDDEASGYCRSDAVGSVVLKRLEDAQADQDPIFGVILGTNTNHCGNAESITRPHEGDQASVFNRIIRESNVDPYDISYVEMHGTGTQAGDATEMKSVLSVFAADHQRTKTQVQRPLYLGSAKANIGHAESASGVSSLIKVLMMMKNGKIPPHCGIKKRMNRHYPEDLEQRGVHIAKKPTTWATTATPRKTFLNNFSAAGGNTAILLEQGPGSRRVSGVDPRSTHVFAVSAKTTASLLANLKSTIKFVESSASDDLLSPLSYTLTARRTQHKYRTMAIGEDVPTLLANLKAQLGKLQESSDGIKPIPSGSAGQPGTIFAFSGQGTLTPSLTKSLFDTNPAYQSRLRHLDEICKAAGFSSFISVIDGTLDQEQVRQLPPTIGHLALVCSQIALADLWMSWGVQPAGVIGHSLGEYPALYTAGVLSAADAIYLVGCRARLLEEVVSKGTHSMLALSCSLEEASHLLEKGCEIVCLNGPQAHVVAGPQQAIAQIAEDATRQGLKSTLLDIPYAFHSEQVDPILEEYDRIASENVTFHPAKVPFVSPLFTRVIAAGDKDTLKASYVCAASRGRVDFSGALRVAAKGASKGAFGKSPKLNWLEIGPHSLCSSMIKSTLGSAGGQTWNSLRQGTDAYKSMTAAIQAMYLAGVGMNWDAYHLDFPSSHQVLELPAYRWDLKNYWIQYRNNFCLTKGDEAPARAKAAPIEPAFTYLSPCAQKVLEESHGAEQSSITVESDLFNDKLLPIMQGHQVNDTRLCPSSMYADVAMTLAKYLFSHRPDAHARSSDPGLNVGNVSIDKPLIAHHTATTHRFRAQVIANWRDHNATMKLYSVNDSGQKTTSHVTLDVAIVPDQRWLGEWQRSSYLIKSRISALTSAAASDTEDCNTMKRKLAYKLFGVLVEYSQEYRGMTEVTIDSNNLEAVAKVNFQVTENDFCIDPRWIDSLGQVAGFIMNASDKFDDAGQVFINHGWSSMRFAEKLDPNKTYHTYNRMQLVEKTTYAGDTYILDGDRIVGVYEGVTFKGMPRRLLNHALPGKANNNQTAQATSPPTTPSAQPGRPQLQRRFTMRRTTTSNVSLRSMRERDSRPQGRVINVEVNTPSPPQDDSNGQYFPGSYTPEDDSKGSSGLTSISISSRDSSSAMSRTSSQHSGIDTPPTPPDSQAVAPKKKPTRPSARRNQAVSLLRQVVTEETGVEDSALQPEAQLADLGIDSLLGLDISSRLQEQFDIQINSTLFLQYDTIREIQQAICDIISPPVEERSNPVEQALPRITEAPSPAPSPPVNQRNREDSFIRSIDARLTEAASEKPSPRAADLPTATSTLLAGPQQNAKEILILFPDGSGSCASYQAFADTAAVKDRAIVGLNSPWRKNASDLTKANIDFSTMTSRYIPEVKRILQHQEQHDRIMFGGWSAGGILAFEALRQLHQTDKDFAVSHLLLLDSPNPIGLENPPAKMYDLLDQLGVFGGGGGRKTPVWLRAHFDAFLRILDEYDASPLPRDAIPESCMIVYAKDGICKNGSPKIELSPNDPREMLWLLNERTDFKAEGWKELLGGGLKVEVVESVNHFSLLDKGDGLDRMVKNVGTFLK